MILKKLPLEVFFILFIHNYLQNTLKNNQKNICLFQKASYICIALLKQIWRRGDTQAANEGRL